MATFPTLSIGESPSLYKIEPIENVLKAKSDGGYEFRRRRYKRAPRNKLETGFIDLSHADYLVLKAFWDTHLEDVAFTYTDYIHGVTRQVRFDEWKPDYKGIGANKRWDVKIKLSEI